MIHWEEILHQLWLKLEVVFPSILNNTLDLLHFNQEHISTNILIEQWNDSEHIPIEDENDNQKRWTIIANVTTTIANAEWHTSNGE